LFLFNKVASVQGLGAEVPFVVADGSPYLKCFVWMLTKTIVTMTMMVVMPLLLMRMMRKIISS